MLPGSSPAPLPLLPPLYPAPLRAPPSSDSLPAADRKSGGVGDLKYPLVSDLKREISEAYGVLAPDGVALRGLFIIDKEGIVQHATINNLAFGRNVDETLRVLQVRGAAGPWGGAGSLSSLPACLPGGLPAHCSTAGFAISPTKLRCPAFLEALWQPVPRSAARPSTHPLHCSSLTGLSHPPGPVPRPSCTAGAAVRAVSP